MKNAFQKIMKRLAGYFFKGLLLLLPVGLTIFLLIYLVRKIDSLVNIGIPGIGIVVVVVGVTAVGILFSGIIGRTLFGLLDEVMSRTPLVKIIYSSIKDLIEAFVGEKKKFSEAVLVEISPNGIEVIGFVTRKDLTQIGLPDKVAVYFPYSYAVTGHVLIVPAEKIRPLDANSADVMKFVVSGGITGLSE
jgi:uncharacterized membrane protein